MPETAGRQKRQRTASPDTNLHIPRETLINVATFLPKPSQALFAIALTAPSSSWRVPNRRRLISATSLAVLSLGKRWEVLDFGEIEYSLAERLSDDDVAAILISINCANRLKLLKLTGCIGINGHGLKPLWASSVLEQLDLSLVGKHESPIIWPKKPSLSKRAVLPILHSIIESDGNKLKHLQFPKRFRSHRNRLFDDFMDEYNYVMDRKYRGICPECSDERYGGEDMTGNDWLNNTRHRGNQFYGLQNFTCYNCTTHFCVDCVSYCMSCEKKYCAGCVQSITCAKDNCSNRICNGCGKFEKCEQCGVSACGMCCYLRECCNKTMCTGCAPSLQCDYGCGSMHCIGCFDYIKGDGIKLCTGCETKSCSHCLFLEHRRDPDNICQNCVEILDEVQTWHASMGRPFIQVVVTRIKPDTNANDGEILVGERGYSEDVHTTIKL